MPDSDIVKELRRNLRLLVASVIVIGLALVALTTIGGLIAAHQRDDLRKQALNTNSALCTFRGDLKDRITATTKFLNEHPNGIPGFSFKEITVQRDNEQRTVDALSVLRCHA